MRIIAERLGEQIEVKFSFDPRDKKNCTRKELLQEISVTNRNQICDTKI